MVGYYRSPPSRKRRHEAVSRTVALVDLRPAGLSSRERSARPLLGKRVVTMPGFTLGRAAAGLVHISLAEGEGDVAEACAHINRFNARHLTPMIPTQEDAHA